MMNLEQIRMKCATAFHSNGVLIFLPGRQLFVTKIRNVAFCFCLVILLITLITLYILNNSADFKNHHINAIILDEEECPKSNLLETSCKLPWIYPIEEDVRGWMSHFGPISCTKMMPNLAYLDENNVLTIQRDLDAKWDLGSLPIRCNVSKLIGGLKPTISNYELIPTNISLGLNEQVKIDQFDQFVVTCFNNTAQPNNTQIKPVIYERAFAGYAKHEKQKLNAPKAIDSPSIIVLILDSTSRNQFLRHAPKSLEYMQQLGFQILNDYVKVGDNSGVNLLPVLSGRTTEKMESTGKEFINKIPVNAEEVEFIWDLMKRKNCVTMINDDLMHPQRGLFAYHHHDGFKKPPVDYYFRPFSLYNVKKEVKPASGHCTIHGQSMVDQHFDIFEGMSRTFKNHCHMSVNFLTTKTHDDPSRLETEDLRIRTMLEKFRSTGILNNTAVVIMGDHGNRIGGVQYSFTGRIEERMPFFSLHLPQHLHEKYPDFKSNFEYNSNRLVSNYDIYKTLRTIALIGQKKKQAEQIPYRGFSLLEEKVPANRSCSDAGIPLNFCTCLENKPLPRYKKDNKIYEQIVKEIHSEFNLSYGKCLKLKTLKIEDDEIRTLSVNPMVRQGWREILPDYCVVFRNKTVDYNSFMEVIFHDIKLNVTSVLDHTLQVLVRVKNYVKDQKYKIPHLPIVLNRPSSNDTCSSSLDDYCKKLFLV